MTKLYSTNYPRPPVRVESPTLQQFFEIVHRKRLTYPSIEEVGGISDGSLRRWKNRKNTPSVDKLEKAANAIGYEIRLVKK